MRVVVTDYDLPRDGRLEATLEAAGLTVEVHACRTEADVAQVVANADALIVQWAPITPAVLDAAPRGRIVSRRGIGYDMIDAPAATARGVAVANTPEYCIEEVAVHSVALALNCLRGIGALDAAVRAG